MIIHHHTIFVATVRKQSVEINCGDLSLFLSDLVRKIGMEELFKPIAIHGKYGFTGMVGIVTSHIAFHYFDEGQILHLDVYSCKEYDLKILTKFIDKYWGIENADILFINRDNLFPTKNYNFLSGKLIEWGMEKITEELKRKGLGETKLKSTKQ